MDLGHACLFAAGIIGVVVAVIHAVLVEKFFVRGLTWSGGGPPVMRLTPPLLRFSGFNWFVGGLALIGLGLGLWPGAVTVVGLLVGSSYLFGASANLWATRGRHPGWALYAVALVLIGIGVSKLG